MPDKIEERVGRPVQVFKDDHQRAQALDALPGGATTRIAVLGGLTTRPIVAAIRAVLLAEGLTPTFYEGPFAGHRQEILDAGSGLYRFKPDLVVLAMDVSDVSGLRAEPATAAAVADAITGEATEWRDYWRLLDERLGVPIVQFTYWYAAAEARAAAEQRLKDDRSLLDRLLERTRRLERELGTEDRNRLDQYLTSVRDLENRLQASRGWEDKPKPVVSARWRSARRKYLLHEGNPAPTIRGPRFGEIHSLLHRQIGKLHP